MFTKEFIQKKLTRVAHEQIGSSRKLGKWTKKPNSRKGPFKSTKIPKFCWKCCNIALQSLQVFYIIVLRAEVVITLSFGSKMITAISTRDTKT